MKEMLIPMKDGKKIYARYYDNKHKHTLLYIHGGPGANCSSFQYCANELSNYMNVLLVDQRGVLRSDKVNDNESCSVDILVDDLENIRESLGISKVIILGHSFGGFLGLIYATKYPDSVEKVIFENPSFNFLDSFKSIQAKAISILTKKKDYLAVKNLECSIQNLNDAKEFLNKWSKVSLELINEVYHLKKYEEYTEDQKQLMNVVLDSDERWQYAMIHSQKIFNDENAFRDISYLISELKCEALLVCGEFDPVLSEKYIKKFKNEAVESKVVTITGCGHFIHTDSCEEYIEIVRNFVQ